MEEDLVERGAGRDYLGSTVQPLHHLLTALQVFALGLHNIEPINSPSWIRVDLMIPYSSQLNHKLFWGWVHHYLQLYTSGKPTSQAPSGLF